MLNTDVRLGHLYARIRFKFKSSVMEQFSVENPTFEEDDEASLDCHHDPERPSSRKENENGSSRLAQARDEEKREYRRCGWLCFEPEVLQRFRTPKWVLFWLCWAGAVQGKEFHVIFVPKNENMREIC